MICYRDKTFCCAPCLTRDCDRKLTPSVEAAARAWWGEPGAPIATADLSRSCRDWTPDVDTHA